MCGRALTGRVRHRTLAFQRLPSSTSNTASLRLSAIKFWWATRSGNFSPSVLPDLLPRPSELTTAPSHVMVLAHPAISTRDTALFLSFRRSLGYRPRHMVPLQELVHRFMGRDIGQHGDIPVSPPLHPPPSRPLYPVLTEPRAGRTGSCRSGPLPVLRGRLGGRHRHRGLAMRPPAPGLPRALHLTKAARPGSALAPFLSRTPHRLLLLLPLCSPTRPRPRREPRRRAHAALYECNEL